LTQAVQKRAMPAPIADYGQATILAALPPDLLSRLFASATPHHVRAGEALFRAGDNGDGCYRLEKGLLKITVMSPDGEELIISFISPGAVVGELAVIDGLPRSATAVAVKDCELCYISRPVFEQSTKMHPELFKSIVDALVARLRETTESFAAASFLGSHARVARALLELAALLGADAGEGRIVIAHDIHQSDLAAMAGIARENVNRILSDWKRRGVVTRLLQHYYINDPAALKRESEMAAPLPRPGGSRSGRPDAPPPHKPRIA
jgi:CRP/FNR family transcriptional regulator, cyclic AMP receptor protein